jgi:hypothetical protein
MIIKTLLVALFWMFLFKISFARTLLFFARFARTLPGSGQTDKQQKMGAVNKLALPIQQPLWVKVRGRRS